MFFAIIYLFYFLQKYLLVQWFPNTGPCHIGMPWDHQGYRCKTIKFPLLTKYWHRAFQKDHLCFLLEVYSTTEQCSVNNVSYSAVQSPSPVFGDGILWYTILHQTVANLQRSFADLVTFKSSSKQHQVIKNIVLIVACREILCQLRVCLLVFLTYLEKPVGPWTQMRIGPLWIWGETSNSSASGLSLINWTNSNFN